MSVNIFISKKPGDGAVTNLRESLSKHEGKLIVLEAETPGFDGNFSEQIVQHLRTHPEVPINLVIDLFQVQTIANWARPVCEILQDRLIGGVSLPPNAGVIVIVRDDSVLERAQVSAVRNRCHFSVKGEDVSRLNPGQVLAEARAEVEPGKRHVDLYPDNDFSR